MTQRQFGPFLRQVRRLIGVRDPADTTDVLLLERFVLHRDEEAFAAILERYGPMVHGVCRRVLGNVHDADDAFQVAFLVLARKAASIRNRGSIGSWLHGVAYRVAAEVR